MRNVILLLFLISIASVSGQTVGKISGKIIDPNTGDPVIGANIIIEVLEPEAPNSFVSFGILETEKEAYLPIYRILN